MSIRKKIDSNETSLFYAEEASLGVLPGSPVWKPGEPNSYSSFGGDLTLLARNPINNSRQRQKGVITDLDAKAGYNQDFTQHNFQDLLQGVMFASYRHKPEVAPSSVSGTAFVVADATLFPAKSLVFASGFAIPGNNGFKVVTGVSGSPAVNVLVSGLAVEGSPPTDAKIVLVGFQTAAGVLDVTATGLPTITGVPAGFASQVIPGEWVFIGGDGADDGFTNAGNNGFKRISAVSGTTWTIGLSQTTMIAETNTAKTVNVFFGRVLKNELVPNIVRRSYQLERQLGAPDDASLAAIQAEYVIGAVADQFVMNIDQADKINCDISFIAIDSEQRIAGDGPKAGTRATFIEDDAFNTSSDFAMLRLNIIDPVVANPDPLFAYLSTLKFTIKNNVKPNKAVAVLGAFDVTAGTFEVMAEVTAYFATVQSVQAVRANRNCEINAIVVKENAGFAIDLPLVALSNGILDVKQDEAIMLPLTMDAARARKINPNMDYTAMFVFFDYLPNVASPE